MENSFLNIDKNVLYDAIIVGSGPAAVSAAIYSSRKGLNTAMIGTAIGGQILNTNEIENIIGLSETTGYEFANLLENHAKKYDISFLQGHTVEEIKEENNYKVLITDDNNEFKTKTVIIATGASYRKLNVPGEQKFTGKGVHYCSTCDGPFYKNLNVVVVGGGNSGVEGALELSNIAKTVTLVEFLPELKADKVLQDKLDKDNITVITNAAIQEIQGALFANKLIYKDRLSNEEKSLDMDGVFIEIGMVANGNLLKDKAEVNRVNEIIIDDKNMSTMKGVFAAGDCTNVKHKQIIVAMGEGAKAALSAFEYVMKEF